MEMLLWVVFWAVGSIVSLASIRFLNKFEEGEDKMPFEGAIIGSITSWVLVVILFIGVGITIIFRLIAKTPIFEKMEKWFKT